MLERELQLRLLFSVIVAGKSAEFARGVVDRLFAGFLTQGPLPFDVVRWHIEAGELSNWLRQCRSGNYRKLMLAFPAIVNANLDLRTCKPEDMEKLHGIGPKTSRFFIIWTRPSARYAALDVHVLRWLRNHGHDAPKSTPASPKQYRRLEQIFLNEADSRSLSPRELDARIWEAGSGAAGYNPDDKLDNMVLSRPK